MEVAPPAPASRTLVNVTTEMADGLSNGIDRDIAEMLQEEKRLLDELEMEREATVKVQKLLQSREVDEECENQLISSHNQGDVTEFAELIDQLNAIDRQEQTFSNSCANKLLSIEEELSLLGAQEGTNAAIHDAENEAHCSEQNLRKARLELSIIARKVVMMQRELDSIPSQLEMAQYQQRFLELYNDMASHHRSIKQHIALFNALVDVRDYMQKEISMLTKIEEALPLATLESNRDSFVQNLQDILKTTDAHFDKVNSKKSQIENEKMKLSKQLASLIDTERHFLKTTEALMQACERNDELHEHIANLDIDIP